MLAWKKNLYAIWVAEFFAVAGFGTISPILPFYIQELGVTDLAQVKLWVGMIQSAGSITLAIFAPIWGRLADSYGRRLMLLRSLFGATVMMVLMGFASHPWQLVVFRAFGGILTGTVTAATVLVASTVPREHAGHSLGLLQSAILVGSAAGPMIGGVFSDIFGYRPTFFLTAGMILAAALFVVRFVREEFTPTSIRGHFWRSVLPDFSILSRAPDLIFLLLVSGVVQIANSVLIPIMPLFIQSLSPEDTRVGTTAGLIIGLRALAGAIAAASVGRISDKIGYKQVLIVCIAGSAIAHLLLLWVTNPSQLLVLRVVTGVFLGGTLPSLNALIVVKAEKGNHGSVYGLSSSIRAGGTALGPMLGAGVAALWGFPAAFLTTVGILAVTMFPLTLGIRASQSPRRESGE